MRLNPDAQPPPMDSGLHLNEILRMLHRLLRRMSVLRMLLPPAGRCRALRPGHVKHHQRTIRQAGQILRMGRNSYLSVRSGVTFHLHFWITGFFLTPLSKAIPHTCRCSATERSQHPGATFLSLLRRCVRESEGVAVEGGKREDPCGKVDHRSQFPILLRCRQYFPATGWPPMQI